MRSEALAAGTRRWFAGGMSDDASSTEGLPLDDHLREDISAPSDNSDGTDDQFTPGQTNAGQQVGGLASATGYGKDQDPDANADGNNPV